MYTARNKNNDKTIMSLTSLFRMKVSCLTIKADSPDSSLLAVYGPEQMVGKLRSLKSGLWEGHVRTCVDKFNSSYYIYHITKICPAVHFSSYLR